MFAATTPKQLEALIQAIQEEPDYIGFDTESSGPLLVGLRGARTFINLFLSQLTGFSLYLPTTNVAWYVPVAHRTDNAPTAMAHRVLEVLLSRTTLAHNAAHEVNVIACLSEALYARLRADRTILCTQVAAWLAGLSEASYGLKELARSLFGIQLPKFQDVVGPGRQFSDMPSTGDSTVEYACSDAWLAYEVWRKAKERLQSWGLLDHFLTTENTFVYVLAEMHRAGLGIDHDRVAEIKRQLTDTVTDLLDEWHFLTDGVNIDSPQQVSRWGYDGPGGWSTAGVPQGKSGVYSADRASLSKVCLTASGIGLRAAQVRLQYQEANKILSTYTDSLTEKANQYPDRRLHPFYNQTGTATGRLSCNYPNVQNIPARSDLGKAVLSAFVPAPGNVLVSADYSQIELRVLAHLVRGEGALADAYRSGKDIHQQTADMIGIPRHTAKIVNFLIVYGGGPSKLAALAGITQAEARKIIRGYEAAYPEILRLRERANSFLARHGYIPTLFRRRRYIPMDDRFRAERLAMNTPVQGGARDVVVAAMVQLWRAIPASWKIVNQVHDDVILEVPEGDAEDAKRVMQEIMQSAYPLRVPLVVEPVSGRCWRDLKAGS